VVDLLGVPLASDTKRPFIKTVMQSEN